MYIQIRPLFIPVFIISGKENVTMRRGQQASITKSSIFKKVSNDITTLYQIYIRTHSPWRGEGGRRRCFYRYPPLTSLLFETLPKFRQTENKLLQLYTNRSYPPHRPPRSLSNNQTTKTPSQKSRLNSIVPAIRRVRCQKRTLPKCFYCVRGRCFFDLLVCYDVLC